MAGAGIEFSSEPLDGGVGSHVRLFAEGRPLSFDSALEAWVEDEAFRATCSTLIAESPYAALRWETPPVTRSTLAQPFEFVLLASPWLEGAASPLDFDEHFAAHAESVLTFPNLGGDALLVVPRPERSLDAYGHLAAFVRAGPPAQVDILWQALGRAARDRVSTRPVWISTAGGGVPWLHVRLDDRPKYYGHAPYRRTPR